MQTKQRKPQNKYYNKFYSLPAFWLGLFVSIISDYQELVFYKWNVISLIKQDFGKDAYHNPFQPYLLTTFVLIVIEMVVYHFTEKRLEIKTLAFTRENPYGEKKQ